MMMDEKVMVTREWLYTKILDASQKKYHGKLCGLVLVGGTGAGKTTLCRQIQVSGVNIAIDTVVFNSHGQE